MNRLPRWLTLLLALLLTGPGGAQDQPARPVTADAKVGALLGKYAGRLESLLAPFGRQDSAAEKAKPVLSPEAASQLAEGCSAFFRELASSENGPPLDRLALQRFKQNFPGGGPAWEPQFLALERALMMGRAQLVNQLWLETIGEYTQANPDKAAYIIGEIDIGSWIQMRLSDLDFAGDIDFSSSTTDVKVNRDLVKLFEGKLVAHTGLDMVGADALLTPHGDASNHVFIDDWGKAYAEMELIRPGAKVKILELDANNRVVLEHGRPKFRIEPGEVLLWEAATRKDGAVELPKIGIEREPMLSLEMYRHEIHDIANGPFANAQKLTKVMKYLERSFALNDKALAAFRSSMPETDPAMRSLAEAMIAAKKQKLSGPQINDIVSQFAQAELGETLSPDNYGSIVLRLEARAQIAMLDNSCRAIAARFNQMAAIVAEPERRQALNQFWGDLQKESAALRASHIDPPAMLEQAVKLAQDVANAKLPPEELAKRAGEMRGLLEDSYKLTPSVIDRIMKFDPYGLLRDYLRDKCKWQVEWIDKFVAGTREKYPNAAALHDKVTAFNNEWNQSLEGSKLMSSMDFADNAIQLFDAYQTGRTHADGLVQASWALAKLKAAGHFPTLALGKSLLDAYEQGDPTAAGMAIGFYYLPTVGAFYQTSQHLKRLDAFGQDENFAKQVALMQQRATFDARGRMTKLTLKIGHGEDETLTLPDTDDPEVRAEAFAKFFINGGDLGDLISGNPAFRYWATLIPRESWEFGGQANAATAFGDGKGWDFSGYRRKMETLRKNFPNSAEIAQLTLLLQDVRSRPAPQDKNTAARNERLQQIENAIEVGLWKGLFSLLEASACPALAQMEDDLKQLEFELRVGDLPRVPRKGIVTRAKAEIAARQSWTQTIDFNSKFILTHYLESYRKVKRIQQQVQSLWTTEWGVNWVAITSPPLKNLLTGELDRGAPRLTCVPDDDVKLAEACLAAHRARQAKMIDHLRFTLNRPIDPVKDRPLLLQIAQLEFEIEHILDDAAPRGIEGLSPESEVLRQDRLAKLNALLAKIGQTNLKLTIEGRAVAIVGKPVGFRTHIEGFNTTTSAKFRIEWDNKLGAGHSVGLTPAKPGEITLRYTAYGKTKSGGEAVVGKSTPFTLIVIADPYAKLQPKAQPELTILGRSSAVTGEKVPLLAKLTHAPTDAAKIVIKWSDQTRKLSLGRGERVLFSTDKAQTYALKAQAVATDLKGVETTLAEVTHPITVTLAPPAPVEPESAPATDGEPAITIDCPPEVVAGVPFTVTAHVRSDILSRAEAVFVTIHGVGTTGGYTSFYDAGSNLRATSGNCIFLPGNDEKTFKVAVYCSVYDRFRRGAPLEGDIPGYKIDRNIIAYASEASPYFGVFRERSDSGEVVGVQLPADQSHIVLKPAGVVLHPPAPWVTGTRTRDYRLWSDATVQVEKVFTDPSGRESKGRCYGDVAILVDTFSPYHDTRLLDGLDKADHATFVREDQNLDKYIALFIEQQKADFDRERAKLTRAKADQTRFESFSANGWSGYIIETKPYSEERDSNFGSSVRGTLFRYGLKLSFTGTVVSFVGTAAGNDWCESVVRQLHAQIPAILGSFSFPPIDLAARAQEQQLEQENRLRVVIGSKRGGGLRPGETTELTATVSGGKPPYRYTWTGAKGTTQSATFKQAKAGRYDVGVSVTDAGQQNTNAQLTLTVSPVQAKIAGVPTEPYFPGQTVNLRAVVEGLPPDAFRCQWAVGPQGIISVLAGIAELPIECRTMAATRIGLTLIPLDGDEAIAVAAPVILQPVLPQFGVTFDPMNAKPGDEVLVTVTPSIAAAKPFFAFKWDKPASGERMEYEDTARVIGFRVQDAKPVAVTATIHAVSSGEEVGKLSATYAPSNYQVTAKVVGPANRGPQPQVWLPGQGLAAAPQGTYGTEEIVLVRADLAPDLAGDAVRWKWTANEGTNILSSELAREIRVVRSTPGQAALTVTATTPENIQLGNAAAGFSVAAAETVKHPKPPVASLAADAREIPLGKTTLLTAGVRDGQPPFTFAWSGSVVPQEQLAVFFGRTAGRQDVVVRVTDALGKSAQASVTLDVKRPPFRVFLAADGLDQPSANGRVTLSAGTPLALAAQVDGGTPPFKFAWSGAASGRGAEGTSTAPSEPGSSDTATVSVTDATGATAEASLTLATHESMLPRSARKPAQPGEPGLRAPAPGKATPPAPSTPPSPPRAAAPTRETAQDAEDKFAGGKARAKELREAGAKLQQAGDLVGAIAKYRESLKFYPDPRLEEHIKKLAASLTP